MSTFGTAIPGQLYIDLMSNVVCCAVQASLMTLVFGALRYDCVLPPYGRRRVLDCGKSAIYREDI